MAMLDNPPRSPPASGLDCASFARSASASAQSLAGGLEAALAELNAVRASLVDLKAKADEVLKNPG